MRDKREYQFQEVRTAFDKGEEEMHKLYSFYFLFSEPRLTIAEAAGVVFKPKRLDRLMADLGDPGSKGPGMR